MTAQLTSPRSSLKTNRLPIVALTVGMAALVWAILHLTVGAVLIPGLRRTGPRGQPRRAAR